MSMHKKCPWCHANAMRIGLMCLIAVSILSAQTPQARLAGTVSDPTGAAVAGASIMLRNQAMGTVATSVTSAEGIYSFPFVNPGQYVLTAEMSGFRRYQRENLVLETGLVQRLDIVLEVGEVSDSISILDEAPLLQTESSSINQLIEEKNIVGMPLVNRRALSLIRLMGNVTYLSEQSNEGYIDMSLAGGRNRQEQWQLDGGNLQAVTLITGIAQINPPAAAMQEVKVEATAYPAEYGRSASGFISMTTKSGTNEFHGELYEFLRNDALDARSFFAPSVAPRKYHVFGGTIGGPILKNKTHFFFSYERNQRREGVTRVMSVPARDEIGGNFSGHSGQILDPLTRLPFAGNIIPSNRLDPVGSYLAQLYPAPNVSGAASGANNFRTNAVNTLGGNSFIGRIDHVFNDRDRIMVRYLDFRSTNRPGTVTPNPGADTPTINEASVPILTGSWFHVFHPAFIGETRFTFSQRGNNDIGVGAFTNTIAGDAGLTGVAPDGMPNISVTGFSALGNGGARLIYPQRTYQALQAFTWSSGKHFIKFGGEWRYSLLSDIGLGARSGAFGFNDIATGRGFGLGALLLGWVNTANVQVLNELRTRSDYFGFYIQDDWKASSRLTLNFGLRWDLDTPRWEQDNQYNGFDPVRINPVSNTPGVILFPGIDNLSKYATTFDKNNFGPRFGFAWRPLGDRTVIRGGYGLMTGPLYMATIGRSAAASFGDQRNFQSPDNGMTAAFLLRGGMPTPPPPAQGPEFGAVPVGSAVRFAPEFFGAPGTREQRNTYAHHIAFSIQQTLPGNLMFESAYAANLGHRLGINGSLNINQIRPEDAQATQSQLRRPFPQFGNVNWVSPDWGNSSYHSLNLKADKRFSRGLNLLANYTWSKFIDDVAAGAEAGTGNRYQSYYARHLEKSLSGNDIRHRLSTGMVYELPVGAARQFRTPNRLVDAFAGGWNIGAIAELRSGPYFGVVEASNRLNTFSNVQRSHVTGNAALPADRSRAEQIVRYFNTDAFTFPGNGVLGNSPRAFLEGPGLINFDISMLKDFAISERKSLQLRGEFFNAFNRPNFSLPASARGNPNFGTIASSRAGRIIQLGIRFVY